MFPHKVLMIQMITGLKSTAVALLSCVTMSGLGREASHFVLNDFMELKYLSIGGIDSTEGD